MGTDRLHTLSVQVCRRTKIRCEPILFTRFRFLSAIPLVVCNGRRPSLFLFIYPLARVLCVCAAKTLCVFPSLQVNALAPLLIVQGSSTMKSTIDRPVTGCIILGIGALVLLPSVKAAAQCVAGWEWVRFYLFLVSCGL